MVSGEEIDEIGVTRI